MTSLSSELTYHPIFPVPMFKVHLPVTPEEEEHWAQQLDNPDHEAYQKSVRGGWQSPKYTNRTSITQIFESLGFTVDAWWVNVLAPGGFNHKHVHPGAEFAAVRYITDATGLQLESPHLHAYYNLLRYWSDNDTRCTKVVNIEGKKGDIIIFPANIQHQVNQTDKLRISQAFNLTCQKKSPQEHS